MRNNRPTVDAELIDDLVAGQLTKEHYRQAILALDAEPSKWRDCALAFLEDQALRMELGALAKGTIDWSPETLGSAVAAASNAKTGSSLKSDLTKIANVQVAASRQHATSAIAPSATNASPISARAIDGARRISSHVLSTAALLMVSFTVGWLGSELIAERERSVAPEIGTVAGVNAKDTPSTSSALPGSNASTQALPLQPQFVLQQPGQFMPLDHEIPQSIRELERRGKVHLESQEGLVRQRLSDGSTVLIPVQEVRVIPATLSF